jgi:general secretion pathway protein G
MKNRKRGFSLVELLIVLAVIAALIATITPVALNAIKKAKATQVAQNLKTLASALENAAYVNGADANGIKKPDGGYFSATDDIKLLARDVDADKYGIAYKVYTGSEAGKFEVYVRTDESVDPENVAELLKTATSVTFTSFGDHTIGKEFTSGTGIQYTVTFYVY